MESFSINNYVAGKWTSQNANPSGSTQVVNPATGQLIGTTPHTSIGDTDHAIEMAHHAFSEWSQTPAVNRVQPLFKLKTLLEENLEELSRTIVLEHGKTYPEAVGDMRRAIQNVEVATGIPTMQMGECQDQIAKGIDCMTYRAPMGVFAGITPFNFPAMVPFWFWPYAVAFGNTFILKPSERVPLTQMKIFELIDQCGFPPGVINLVQGGKETVQTILKNPKVQGVSFVGSTPVAKAIYEEGNRNGKRIQALGGAKNFLVLMPDAPIELAVQTMVESCLGCAGERCLAGSTLVGVGQAYEAMKEAVVKEVQKIVVGDGADPKTNMGPVISAEAKENILRDIQKGQDEGANLIVDGRNPQGVNPEGYFLGPSVFEGVRPGSHLATKEIFGPVIGLMKLETLDEAIKVINSSPYGNTASLFTSNGGSARHFMNTVAPSMVGINLGVPAPMSFFSFGGSKDSFFGDIKAHGSSAVEFFTEKRTHMVRWFGANGANGANAEGEVSPHWQK